MEETNLGVSIIKGDEAAKNMISNLSLTLKEMTKDTHPEAVAPSLNIDLS